MTITCSIYMVVMISVERYRSDLTGQSSKTCCVTYLFYQSFPASVWWFLQLGAASSLHDLSEYFCQSKQAVRVPGKTPGDISYLLSIKPAEFHPLSFRVSQGRLEQPILRPDWG